MAHVAVICVSGLALKSKVFWVPGQYMFSDPLTKRHGNAALANLVMTVAKYALTSKRLAELLKFGIHSSLDVEQHTNHPETS